MGRNSLSKFLHKQDQKAEKDRPENKVKKTKTKRKSISNSKNIFLSLKKELNAASVRLNEKQM